MAASYGFRDEWIQGKLMDKPHCITRIAWSCFDPHVVTHICSCGNYLTFEEALVHASDTEAEFEKS